MKLSRWLRWTPGRQEAVRRSLHYSILTLRVGLLYGYDFIMVARCIGNRLSVLSGVNIANLSNRVQFRRGPLRYIRPSLLYDDVTVYQTGMVQL